MVQDNGRFQISLPMVEYLKLQPFAGPTKKLLLVLIYLQELEEECWPTARLNERGDGGRFEERRLEQHFCHVSHLHSLGLAPKSRSSGFLEKPLDDLLNVSGFFDELVLKPGKNGYLSWQFGIFPAALMTDMDIYALIKSKDIALCTGDLDVAMLTQIMLRYKMRFPAFSLLTADPKSNLLFDPNDTLILNQRAFIAKLKRLLKNGPISRAVGWWLSWSRTEVPRASHR